MGFGFGFGLIYIIGALIPILVWVFIIVMIVKAVKNSKGIGGKMADIVQQQRMNQRGPASTPPSKYQTINSHYSQQTLNGTAMNMPNNGGHTHAYEHKVQPIGEASVHERFEDRKEAYIERKQQMKADLPKTSYSKMEEANKNFNTTTYSSNGYNTYGINGDNASVTSAYEEKVTCKYCGAENIVPRSRNKKYNCYFCREEI